MHINVLTKQPFSCCRQKCPFFTRIISALLRSGPLMRISAVMLTPPKDHGITSISIVLKMMWIPYPYIGAKPRKKYTERKLLLSGVIPWQIYRSYQNLVEAFVQKDMQKIIRHSADL